LGEKPTTASSPQPNRHYFPLDQDPKGPKSILKFTRWISTLYISDNAWEHWTDELLWEVEYLMKNWRRITFLTMLDTFLHAPLFFPPTLEELEQN
jgi:hypothetical protein